MRHPTIRNLTELIRSGLSRFAIPSALPATCAGCGVIGDWFCETCLEHLRPDGPVGCMRCGTPGIRRSGCWRCGALFPLRLERLRAGFRFDDSMRRAVHRFKYAGEYQRGRDLGMRLSHRFNHLFPRHRFDLIVPVPLHPRRYRQRGFNQSSILADELSPVVGAPVVEAVRRVRNTKPQAGLTADARTVNLQDAFELVHDQGRLIAGSTVLIVDDVTTTGATVCAVAGVLSSAGASSISAVALARER